MNTLTGDEIVALVVISLLGIIIAWQRWLIYRYRVQIKAGNKKLGSNVSDAQATQRLLK
jgi:hypothetical protein